MAISPRTPATQVDYIPVDTEEKCRLCGFYIGGELVERKIFPHCTHNYHLACVENKKWDHCPFCPLSKASAPVKRNAKRIAALCCCIALVGAVVASAFVFGCQKDCFFH
jgi:hypothetical protein